jgi:hypothetical protein
MGELQQLVIGIWMVCLSPLILVLAGALHILFNRKRRRTRQGKKATFRSERTSMC